ATRDPLTGAYNRRSFFEQADIIWQRARARNSDVCCVMVDIDHFKWINDQLGHGAGDQVIRDVAGILLSESSAVTCRYGGEEFSLILPDLDLDQAIELAERIRLKLTNIELRDRSVTASFGVAEPTDGMVEVAQLIDLADRCLYSAKRKGRNRTIDSR